MKPFHLYHKVRNFNFGLRIKNSITITAVAIAITLVGFSTQLQANPIQLTGIWQSSIDKIEWKSVELPSNLKSVYSQSENLQTIYLRRIINIESRATQGQLGWQTGIVSDAAKFFVNGQELRLDDRPNTIPDSYDRDRLLLLPNDISGIVELEIQLQPFFEHEFGLISGNPIIDSFHKLKANQTLTQIYLFLLPVLFLALALYYLLLAVLQESFPNERFAAITLSFFLIVMSLYLLHRSDLKYQLHYSLLDLKRVEYICLMLLLPCLSYFFYFLFSHLDQKTVKSKIELLLIVVVNSILVLSAIWIFTSSDIKAWDHFNITIVHRILWPILFVWMARRLIVYYRLRMSKYLIIGTMIAILSTVVDIFSHQGWIHLPSIAPVSLIAFVLSLSLSKIDQSSQIRRKLADLNSDLENRVIDRTQELNHTLTEVQSLKEQQDGDYYLTSLILKPLTIQTNNGKNKSVAWSSLIKQKKDFQFRNRFAAIGGDINIVAPIKLRNREYLTFMNADAMGKSIQGAGGAVVLGTVFRACINRTERQTDIKSLYPEEWLRSCYDELQSAFVSFDGSMMASAIIGLFDLQAGCLYHWNAEHPALVLYRRGQARLIEAGGLLRRLGAPLPDQVLKINVLPLEKGDRIYVGTDGRDDIKIENQYSRRKTDMIRIINDDPMRFVNSIERIENRNDKNLGSNSNIDQQQSESSFDLQIVLTELTQKADLTDDIALLRFEYLDQRQNELSRQLRDQASALLEKRSFIESLPKIETYIDSNPADEQSLRVGIRVAQRLGHPLAEKWKRRLRLRETVLEK